jgi:hypothetical protein
VLGWIKPSQKYVVRQSGVVTIQLDDLEQQPAPPGYLLAEIPLPGGRFYTVEARGRTGYDMALPAAGVLIHEIDPRRENKARLVEGKPATGDGALLSAIGGWPVGSVFIDRQNNVAVSVDRAVTDRAVTDRAVTDRAGDGAFVVTLYTGALPWPLPAGQLQANESPTTGLQWQPTPGAHEYEVQITRMSAENSPAEWGATFVSDRPSLEANLAPGQYRWQVRALPTGPWSPSQVAVADRGPTWRSAEQVVQLSGFLRVAPMISAGADGQVDIAWAQDDLRRKLSVTRAALQGDGWAVQDQFDVPPSSRRGFALSFTAAGDLKVAWPSAAVASPVGIASPVVALDAGGRAHTIWAGTGSMGGIFSAIIDAHAPSAGPVAMQTPRVQAVPVAHDTQGSSTSSPALALDGNGNAQAVWIDMRDGKTAVYGAEQQPNGLWGPSVALSDPNEAVYGRPAVAADAIGRTYAVWQNSLDCSGPSSLTQVSFAERQPGGQWQPEITLAVALDGSRLIDPVVATNAAGEVYVAWGQIKDKDYRLYSAYRGVSGRWEPAHVVAAGSTDAGSVILSLATNRAGEAYLTWADTQGDQTAVRFAATH